MTVTINGSASADFATALPVAEGGTGSSTSATAVAELAPIQLQTAVATTSGTSIDFTGIPAGVKRITVMGSGVSTNGTSNILVRLGDSGGIETTGYTGGWGNPSAQSASTVGFVVMDSTAANAYDFVMDLNLIDVSIFSWMASGMCISSAANQSLRIMTGNKPLSAVLDRISLTTAGGSNTFDAGKMNISWEF